MKKHVELAIGLACFVAFAVKVIGYIGGEPFTMVDAASFMVIAVCLIEWVTWKSVKQKSDELGKLIQGKAGSISYLIVVVLVFVTYITDRIYYSRADEFGNVPLFILLMVSCLLHPVITYIVSRTYK